MSYRVVLRPAAVRALQRMPEKIAAACWEFIHGPLAESPHQVGEPLLEPVAPQYSARRGEYRVLYLIEDEQVTVIITSVSHRADAYRTRQLPHAIGASRPNPEAYLRRAVKVRQAVTGIVKAGPSRSVVSRTRTARAWPTSTQLSSWLPL